MMLSSLLALALSFTASTTNVSNNSETIRAIRPNNTTGLVLPIDHHQICFFYCTLDNNLDGLYNVTANINYDENYNEYFYISCDFNRSNNYVYVSFDSWLHFNYNVSSYFAFCILDDDDNILLSYSSLTYFLVNGDNGYHSFSGDTDVMSFNYPSTHLPLYFYGYVGLDLLSNDLDEVATGDYQEGYTNGYNQGQHDGYQQGKTDGYQEGKTDGYNDGYNTGKTDGYNLGYNTALGTHSFSFTNLFASISDTPILMIRRLFGFEIFGQSVLAIFMSLFTALIVIKVIKKLI